MLMSYPSKKSATALGFESQSQEHSFSDVEIVDFDFPENHEDADSQSEPVIEELSTCLSSKANESENAPFKKSIGSDPQRFGFDKLARTSTSPALHSVEAEEGLLACCLLDGGRQLLDKSVEAGFSPDFFYLTRHQILFASLIELSGFSDQIDEIVLLEYLRKKNLEDSIGGLAAIYTIQERAETSSHGNFFLKTVKDYWLRRKTFRLGRELIEELQSGESAHCAIEDFSLKADELAFLSRSNLEPPSELSLAGKKLLDEMLGGQDLFWTGDIPEVSAALVRLPNGKGLFYRNELNEIHGAPGRGKTWIALAAAIQVLSEGGRVLILDPESTARKIIRRLRILGCSAGAEKIIHLNPTTPAEWDTVQIFALNDFKPSLVVIDGVASYIQADGGVEDVAADCLRFLKTRCNPFKQVAGVLLTDHVTKSKDSQGRYSRGSGAKLGEYKGAVYEVRTSENLSPQNGGVITFIVAKDNEGSVGANGEAVAALNLSPIEDYQTTASFSVPDERLETLKPTRMSIPDTKSHGRELAQSQAWKLADWIQAVQRESGRTANNLIAGLKDYALAADNVVTDTAKCGKAQPALIGPRDMVSEFKQKLESDYEAARQRQLLTP